VVNITEIITTIKDIKDLINTVLNSNTLVSNTISTNSVAKILPIPAYLLSTNITIIKHGKDISISGINNPIFIINSGPDIIIGIDVLTISTPNNIVYNKRNYRIGQFITLSNGSTYLIIHIGSVLLVPIKNIKYINKITKIQKNIKKCITSINKYIHNSQHTTFNKILLIKRLNALKKLDKKIILKINTNPLLIDKKYYKKIKHHMPTKV
jgi:hypothetical protein